MSAIPSATTKVANSTFFGTAKQYTLAALTKTKDFAVSFFSNLKDYFFIVLKSIGSGATKTWSFISINGGKAINFAKNSISSGAGYATNLVKTQTQGFVFGAAFMGAVFVGVKLVSKMLSKPDAKTDEKPVADKTEKTKPANHSAKKPTTPASSSSSSSSSSSAATNSTTTTKKA